MVLPGPPLDLRPLTASTRAGGPPWSYADGLLELEPMLLLLMYWTYDNLYGPPLPGVTKAAKMKKSLRPVARLFPPFCMWESSYFLL